ncbi:MAG: LamG-like jellyroll fold domain-containing protein [Chitinophagales bacterium]
MKTTSFLVLILATFLLSKSSFTQSNYIGSGISCSFDGSTGTYIDLGNVFNDLNFPLTVEAWVYPTEWTLTGDYAPIMATDNIGVGGSYYGFWFRFNNLGKLIFEIGDGSGAGSTDRRGKITTSTVNLNTWTHVAVVATSVTDIKFYFNGVLQTSSNTDGSATNTSILHTTYPAAIGHHITPTTEHNLIGMLDEIRLWQISLTETEIRTHMCKKYPDFIDNLIGYWNFDESYDTETAVDFSIINEEGALQGGVTKVTSGAPIGDESIFQYPADWTGIKMKLISDNDDYLRIKKIENDPLGMHVYRVDSEPYYNDGLNEYVDFYYGIFPVNGDDPVEYGIAYRYSTSNGVVTEDNQPNSSLFYKNDGSVETWTDLTAVMDPVQNFIREVGNTTRKEIIFNILVPLFQPEELELKKMLTEQTFIVSPNPSATYINVSNVNMKYPIYITDIFGRLIFVEFIDENTTTYELDVSTFESGSYFIIQNLDGKIQSGRFEVIR